MTALATFADRFQVRGHSTARRTQDAGGVVSGALSGLVASAGVNLDTSAMSRAGIQVQHYRLWTYIAVMRNAMTASREMPNVSVLTRGEAAKQMAASRAPVNQVAQKFLRQHYQGVLQSQLSEDENLSPVVPGHPLPQLLQNVNDTDWWVSFAFETYMFLGLTGSFYWWVLDNGFGVPSEMWVIPPQWITPEYEKTGALRRWNVRPPSGKQIYLPPNEVICEISKNPRNKLLPQSPVDAGAEWVLNGEGIEQVRSKLLEQGIWPSLVVELGDDYNDPDDKLIEAVGEKFMARAGGSRRAGQPLILPPDTKAQPWSMKPAELEFDKSGETMRDNTLALHGTPRAAAGLAHDLNRANIEGSNLIYAQYTIIPMQLWLAGTLTWKLAQRFDPRLRVWFSDCRPNDGEQELKEVELDMKYGAMTPDERRANRGRDPLNSAASQKTFILGTLKPLEDFEDDPDARAERQAKMGPQKAGPEDEQTDADSSSKKKKPPAAKKKQSFEAQVTRTRRYARVSREFRRLHSEFERAAQRPLAKFWRGVKKHALAVFDADPAQASVPSPSEMVPPGDFRGNFNQTLRPLWDSAARSGVAFEQQLLGLADEQSLRPVMQAAGDSSPYPDIEMEIPEVIQNKIKEFLSEREAGVWSKVMATTHEALQTAISEGINAGEGMREIRNRVAGVLDNRAGDAVTIARTEATASLNYGQQALRENEGIEEKIWLSTFDNRTRATHVAADSQRVGNKQPFKVGGYNMQHPGDGSGGAPAGEIVACRCCATGYVE